MLFQTQIWSLSSSSSSKSNTSKRPVYFQKFEHGFSSLAWLPARNTVNGGIDSAREMQENFTIAWYVFIYNHFSPVKADTPLEPFNKTVLLVFIFDNIFIRSILSPHYLFFKWRYRWIDLHLESFGKRRNENAENSPWAFRFSILSLVCPQWNLPRLSKSI
jgi:hypothetical protein